MSKTGAEMLFEVFSQRYERTSTLVTSNLPFAEWTEIPGSERLTGALLSALDPVALAVACVLMTLVGLLAAWIPASRAARVDPMTVLRDEG